MRRALAIFVLSGFGALSCAFGQQAVPCNAGTAGDKVIPVQNGNITYCISDFGWSDTWLLGTPTQYNFQDDLLSGDDAFNLKYTTPTGGHGPGSGWLSPVLDQGTLTAQPAPGWTRVPPLWTVVTSVHSTGANSTESVIQNPDGLVITIDTLLPAGAFGLQISLTIQNTSSSTIAGLQLADYFNFHPNGSNFPNNLKGTTQFVNNCIVTTGEPSVFLNGTLCGLFAPTQYDVGLAVAGTNPAVWQDVGNGTYNNNAGPVGPADSAGAMEWNLGDLAPGASVRFAVGKNVTPIGPPAIGKQFVPAVIPIGGISALTFTINNTNSVQLTGIGFTDGLPGTVVVAPPGGVSGTCGGGTISAVAGGNAVSLSGATLPGGGSCTFSVNVTSSASGVFLNTTSRITSNEGGSGTPATSTLTVAGPPVISKMFSPGSIPVNGASSLIFKITNPNASVNLTGVGFTDTLPGNVVVATPNGESGTCGAGTISAPPGGNTITLTGAGLLASGMCTFSVNVTSAIGGAYTNTTGPVMSNEGGPGNTATSILDVIAPPVISKAFNSSSILQNLTSTLTITVRNPNTFSGLTGIGFSDPLPSGVNVATPNGLVSTCGGTATAVAGSSSITLSGGSLLASGTCTVTVTVTGTTLGAHHNVTTNVTSNEGGPGNQATSDLTVTPLPAQTISKAFAPNPIRINGTSVLTVTITNPTASGLTGVAFSDSLPAGVVVAATPGLTSTCNGTATAAAGSGTISLSAGSIAANASCTIMVTVTATTAGEKDNTTSAVSSNEAGTGNMASATLYVYAPPVISKVFNPSTVSPGGPSVLKFTISNPNTFANPATFATGGLTGVGFGDTFPGNITVGNPNGVTSTCNGTFTAVPGAGSVSLSGATLPPNGSCMISVNVLAGQTRGMFVNTTGNVTSTEGGNGNTASAPLTVPLAPTITKNFAPSGIAVNGTSALTFTIGNPNSGVALSGVGFSDTLPGSVKISNPNGLVGSCPSGTISAPAGGQTISLIGAVLAGGTSCTFSVNVTSPTGGRFVNTTSQVTSNEGGPGDPATSTLTVGILPPLITKAFGEVGMGQGSSTTLTFMLSNPGTNPTLTQVAFSDTLPAGLLVANPSGLPVSCGSGTITAVSGTNLVSLSGATFPSGGGCTFSINITGVMPGRQVNTTSTLTSFEAPPGDPATAEIFVGDAFQITYEANLDKGDSVLDLTNTGASGAGLAFGTTASVTGSICANIYAFSPDEQIVSCCSCPVTPNGLVSLSTTSDILPNLLTSANPTSLVIKIVASLPVGGSCVSSAAAVSPGSLANGVKAFDTTLHATPMGTYAPTEKPFSTATLSAGELNRLTSLCNFIIANGSGFGICRSCRLGGLGAAAQ